MPAPITFAPTATRTMPNTAPGGAVGQYTGQYGTNYPRITVQEPLRSNDNSRQLGFPERGIGKTEPRYENPQRPIDYVDIPIEKGLPVWRGGQGTQPPQSQGGQTYAPSSPSGSSGGSRFIPIMIPQTPSPFGGGSSAGFDTVADYEAWKQGESRGEINRQRAANEHMEKYKDSFGGPGNYRTPGSPVNGLSNDQILKDANAWRSRNGLAPIGPDGASGLNPKGLGGSGNPIGDAAKNIGKLFPGGDSGSPDDPYRIPNPLDTSDRNPNRGPDPFAPLPPGLPGNPFPPGTPGGGIDPGSDPINFPESGIWRFNYSYSGPLAGTGIYSPGSWSTPGASDAAPSFGKSGNQWHLYQKGVITYANWVGLDHSPSLSGLTWENTTPEPIPGRPPSVFPFPPRPDRVGRPTDPLPGPSPSPAPGPSPSPAPGPSPSPAPGPAPYNPLKPAPAPNRQPSPSPSPFLPPLPMPLPMPGPSPAPNNTTPLRSPNPGNAPKPIGGASPSPSPSPSPNPGSGSGSGSSSPPPPSPCSYKEDETQAETVDYFTVTPIGRLKTPKTIQVHEKMAEATKLEFEVLGQIRESLDKIEKNTKIAKVMHMVSMATTIHNAIMLSRDLAETLGNVTSMTFTAVGRMTGVVGESDFVNVNEILGSQFNDFMERTLGKELWSGTKESWLKASRIYQSGANIVNSVRDIADSTRDIGEFTAQNVSKIGNALKKYRVVGFDAYGTMDEDARAKSKFFRNFDKAIEKGERLENAASSLGGVSGNVLSIQDEVKEIKENRDAFKKGVEEWGKKDEAKQKKDEAASKVDETIEEKDLK